MTITVLVAGTNDPSNCDTLADAFIEGLKEAGPVTIMKKRLRDLSIDHFTLDCYRSDFQPEEHFRMVQDWIQQSDGLVIASPVWNFGIPAHLKNLIDRMGAFALDAETRTKGTLRGLPFFLVYTGGTAAPAWALQRMTTSALPVALSYFKASFYGQHFEPKCVPRRGEFTLVVDQHPERLRKVRQKGHNFAKGVHKFMQTGRPPLSRRLIYKGMKLGEAVLKKISPY
ncbi:MAG TPA: NAD(P)H-dependent oxidoreductase [Candidatus Peribacteraceae bacterium]|nr:NAD(P)H-dependent oxidoreductase [Candidatus Peribacteraceae bacterium]